MKETNSIRYRFDGPIPDGKFTASQISRMLAIAKTLSQPKLPKGLEEMAFAIICRMVLNILIDGSDRVNAPSQIRRPGRRESPSAAESTGE